MADKKYCDLCQKEIASIDRVYFISYGEKAGLVSSMIAKGHIKKGEVCRDCCLKIEALIQELKRKK